MSLFDDNHGHKTQKCNKCDGCACDTLRNLDPGRRVTINIVGVATPLGPVTFACFDPETCCATFISQATTSGAVTVVDCRDIASISVTPL